jgi:hypothetical protein
VLLLQYLLRHKQSLDNPTAFPPPPTKILSDDSVQSIFTGTLPPSAWPGMVEMYNPFFALSEETSGLLQYGDVDWTTAFAVYQPKSGRRKEGFGRLPGSCGLQPFLLSDADGESSAGRFHHADVAWQRTSGQDCEKEDRPRSPCCHCDRSAID